MANRIKEDEKNEKIIRGLLKLPSNRRCINCNSLGPQYVCTNFWTFVCTNCSGMHREFTHRVKSVSMAKFTSEEVNALQGGGNERAKEIYFKEWDPHRHFLPDNSNIRRLRDFIKQVYVDRRYSGEKNTDMSPSTRMGLRADLYDSRDKYLSGSRTPPAENTFERPFTERSRSIGQNDIERRYKYNYDERRNSGYRQEFRQGSKRAPVRFEVVDDRYRDDKVGSSRRSEVRRFPDGESKMGGRASHCHKSLDMSGFPVVRSVRDILGEDVPPLRVAESPKANGGRATQGSSQLQGTASSNNVGSNNANSVEVKTESLGSLIDFDIDPEPPDVVAASPQPTNAPGQSITQPTTNPSFNGDNWAALDFSTRGKVPPCQDPSKANSLETLLFQLSAPATAPLGSISMLPADLEFNPSFSETPNNQSSNISFGQNGEETLTTTTGQPSQNVSQPIQQNSFFNVINNQSAAPRLTPPVATVPSKQKRDLSQGPLATETGQLSQPVPRPIQETSGEIALSPASMETKSNGRKELPEDLFASTFSSVPVPVQSWQAGPSHSMPFGMQYPTVAPATASPKPSKSVNPFDLNTEPTIVHTPTFPNMASLQGALQQMAAPPGLLRTSSLGNPFPQWTTPQDPSYGSAMQLPSYVSALPQGAYTGQQIPSNMSVLGHQGTGRSSADEGIFGVLNNDQEVAGRYSQPATQNYFTSLGGNPFG